MKILILDADRYQAIDDEPVPGRYYYLEDAETGTGAQNRAFHALVQEWFLSGCHSYEAKTWLELREYVKRDLGAGFESYRYVVDGRIKKCQRLEEIPNTATDRKGVLKSWAKYTKSERRKTMDLLIATMIESGVTTKHFYEILSGMEAKIENRIAGIT